MLKFINQAKKSIKENSIAKTKNVESLGWGRGTHISSEECEIKLLSMNLMILISNHNLQIFHLSRREAFVGYLDLQSLLFSGETLLASLVGEKLKENILNHLNTSDRDAFIQKHTQELQTTPFKRKKFKLV